MAGQNAVGHMEVGLHGLVVRHALRIIALHDTLDLLRRLHSLLLHHLIVADDAQDDIGSHHGETGDLVVGEEFVRHLDDTFAAYFLRRVVEADRDRSLQIEEP